MTYKNQVIIAGGGGKGGGGGGAIEAPNTLRSKQVAHIIDLLGEGEWEGLIDGPAGIYLNDVSLFTPSSPTGDVLDIDQTGSDDESWGPAGTWNFKGITVEFRHGTQSQSAIRSASGVSFVQAVNLPVVKDTPVVSAITNPNVDTAIVNVQVNSLYQQDTSNGNISGYHVDIEVQARKSGGGWTTIKADRIEGKAMSSYIRSYAVDLHAIDEHGPWEVRVVRISDDDADSAVHSDTVFVGMDLMSRDKFRYPNSVLCSIGVDASQLSAVPTRAYDCKMLRVRVPTNYDPIARTYAGVWDGSFKIAWTNNPAWCMYDMITNERYGLGEYVDEDLTDKWALYTIGRYCDQFVPDGFGGTEPRFTLNVYFQTAEEAIPLLQNMASVFRGILYYLNESITPLQDSPSDAVYQFNTTNIENGTFSYAGASSSTRHTVAMVVWNNPEIGYKQDIEVVEDAVGLLRFGYRPITVQAMGCTTRGQAHRLGLWTLYVEQYEADIVTFSTALEGTGVQPGNIIDVYDPLRADVRLGGRVLGVAGSTMYPDQPLELSAGTHTVSFVADDGSIVTRNTTVAHGTYASLTLSGAGSMPSVGSIFGVQTAGIQSQQFRIISISEAESHKYEITAVAYNFSKYDYIENGLKLAQRPTRYDGRPPEATTNVTFHESLYLLADGSISIRLIASWDQDPFVKQYAVSYKVGSGNWSDERIVDTNSFTLESVVEGWTYFFRIASISVNDIRGGQTEAEYVVLGEKIPPPEFDYLYVNTLEDGTRLIYYGYDSGGKPLDYLGAQVRYAVGDVSDWNAMTPLGEGFFTYSPIESAQAAAPGFYTVAVRAEDRTHHVGPPSFVLVDLTDGRVTITTINEARARIAALASDNVLSKGEKRNNQILWNQIISYHDTKIAQAIAVGIVTEKDAFITAYNALATYLTTAYNAVTGEGVGLGGGDWNDINTDSIINGMVFRAKFNAVFDAAEALDTALVRKAQLTADGAVASIAEAALRIDVISSDNVLSKGEKRNNQVLWNQIISYYNAKVGQATAVGITTEKNTFVTAYNDLATYLTTAYNSGTGYGVGLGGGDWNNINTDSIISGTVFKAKFQALFDAAEVLEAKLVATAQALAQSAVDSIAAATTRIDTLSSDNVLSRNEKLTNQIFWNQIISYYNAKVAQATSVGITTEKNTFVTAYNDLATYLTTAYNAGTGYGVGTGGGDWNDVSTDSTISGTVFKAKFQALFDAAQVLEAKLVAVAQGTATTANTTANTANTTANTANATAQQVSSGLTDYIAAANTTIAQTAADGTLATYEKAKIQQAYTDISNWNTALAARITTFNATYPTVVVSRTAFDAAYLALIQYLSASYNSGTGNGVGAGTNDWINQSTNSQISGPVFRQKWGDVYAAGAALDAQLSLTSPMTAVLTSDRSLNMAMSSVTSTATTALSTASAASSDAAAASSAAAAASAAAATKLNKSSADILSGTISFTSAGGFKTGTITWDSAGNVTGGTGVAMTAKGIVAANSGSATLTLNGTTGAASFSGDISGGASIDIVGNATFNGLGSAVGQTFAVRANTTSSATGGGYGQGAYGWYGKCTVSSGQGIFGDGTASFSSGVQGNGTVSSAYGVTAYNTAAGTALRVLGTMTIDNSTLVTNLNANYLGGNLASAFATASHTHTISILQPSATTVKFQYSTDNVNWVNIYMKRVEW